MFCTHLYLNYILYCTKKQRLIMLYIFTDPLYTFDCRHLFLKGHDVVVGDIFLVVWEAVI